MWRRKTSKNVWESEEGFTFIEAIAAMLLLTVIMAILPLMFGMFAVIEKSVAVEEDYEWNLFLIQVRDEMADSDWHEAAGNRVIVRKGERIIQYEKHNEVLRRRVNDAGHEIILQKVEFFHASGEGESTVFRIRFAGGREDAATFPAKRRPEDLPF